MESPRSLARRRSSAAVPRRVGAAGSGKSRRSRWPSRRPRTPPRGFFGTIGLSFRYVGCGFLYACIWAAQLTCAEYETTSYATCTRTRDDGYNKCTEQRDNGYNKCTQTRDDGYNQCCTWWPCSWACNAWVRVSNIVCVAWTWISNVVCVAWTWVSYIVCVAWTWIVATLCRAFVWMKKICP
jgi:hypothetical protein